MTMEKRTVRLGVPCSVRQADRRQNTTEHGRRRRTDSAMNQRAFENEAELHKEGLVIQKELMCGLL
jgi:hypothetical protein